MQAQSLLVVSGPECVEEGNSKTVPAEVLIGVRRGDLDRLEQGFG